MKNRNMILLFLITINIFLNACTKSPDKTLRISAIPDQDPEHLNRLYGLLAKKLSKDIGVKVKYIPVINYTAAVNSFRTGNSHLVWFGGLTGVQARLQTPGSKVIAQRDVDENFHSVFIANTNTDIPKINGISELRILKDRRFTFGSESSTSGRLMPQYYLKKANVSLKDFKGNRPGFSGSHDATIMLVASGAYEAGALNEQVWLSSIKRGKTDPNQVKVIWRTPSYPDYHWLARPDLDEKFGNNFTLKIKSSLLNLKKRDPDDAKILTLFNANKFIPANTEDYNKIEKIGREIGKIK